MPIPLTDTNASKLRRRKLLGWGCAGLAAAVGGRPWQLASPDHRSDSGTATGKNDKSERSEDTPSGTAGSLSDRDAYVPHVGSIFQFSPDSGEHIPCTLIVVGPEKIQQAPAARFASYSLVFKVDDSHRLGEGIYRLKHEHLPETEFFLTPVGPIAEGRYLEAIISRKIA